MSASITVREAARQRQAAEILAALGVMERWATVGAPKLVGAAACGLMVASDIDIEIYSPSPSVEAGFGVVGELARQPGVWKVRFSNELDGPDQGLYWQLRYRAKHNDVWKIDMWLLAHDHPGPRSDDLVEAMKRALTTETRIAILTIKEALIEAGQTRLRPIRSKKRQRRSWRKTAMTISAELIPTFSPSA